MLETSSFAFVRTLISTSLLSIVHTNLTPQSFKQLALCGTTDKTATLLLSSEIEKEWFKEPFVSMSGAMLLTARRTSDLLDLHLQYGMNMNTIISAAVSAYMYFVSEVKPSSSLSELDVRLLNEEKAFWLTHWIGVYVGNHMMQDNRDMLFMIKQLYFCSPAFEFNSISHGITWHFMAKLPWQQVHDVVNIAKMLCFEEMRFYLDCFHGIGHGIVHSFLLSSRSISYSATSQLYHVQMNASAYDATVGACGVFTFLPASGCVDGVTHSIFNYMPFKSYPTNWADWCAPRLWPPMCYRNLLQYGPLSVAGYFKLGRPTNIERLADLAGAHEMNDAVNRLTMKCSSLSSDLQLSCSYGIFMSSWRYFHSQDALSSCNTFGVHDAKLLCKLVIPKVNSSLLSRFSPFGAKLMPRLACPRRRCPYEDGETHA